MDRLLVPETSNTILDGPLQNCFLNVRQALACYYFPLSGIVATPFVGVCELYLNTYYQMPNGIIIQPLPATSSALVTSPQDGDAAKSEWRDDVLAAFICKLCNKTFYNAIALQNHKNLNHDNLEETGMSVVDGIGYTRSSRLDHSADFRFIPLSGGHTDPSDLTPKVFSRDTTYFIIRLTDQLGEVEAKRRRLEGAVRRAQMKPVKSPIDLRRGPFTCLYAPSPRPELQCRLVFHDCCEYSLHYREAHTKRRKAVLRCQICERRLDRDQEHREKLTFTCRACGQIFLEAAEYDAHCRTEHAKTKPHQCSLCAKRFTQQGGLQQHMRMHTGVRPFACTHCPKAFTQKAGLDQHLRTHTKVKPFKCIICRKCFSQSVHLRQHMRTHTNIQPFVCPVCGRRFKQTSHLNFHMRSHDALAQAAYRRSTAYAEYLSGQRERGTYYYSMDASEVDGRLFAPAAPQITY